MRQHWPFLLIGLMLVPHAAWPQGDPLGPEFRVNSYTTGVQYFSSVAADASGNFVVVWQGYDQDGLGSGVFGQRYASSGATLGPEFQVNTYTTGVHRAPSLASDSSGNFAVVFAGAGQDGSGYGVFGQRYASSGVPLGPEFRVNTYTTSSQIGPSITAHASGNFVVMWASGGAEDGSGYGVFGQRYASSGAALGPEFQVNTYTTGDQYRPSLASDGSGNFVVAWGSPDQDGSSWGVFGQRYASSGAPLGPEFRVNTSTTSVQFQPSVAADSSGNFVVAWTSSDGSAYGVFGQRYDSAGAPLGAEFRINSYTSARQANPSVASDPSGNLVVVWDSFLEDGSADGVFGQRYASSGAPLGPEFQVNTETVDPQRLPSVRTDPSGRFVVVWSSQNQDGSSWGIFGQRYGQIVPVELMRFGVE